MCEAIRTTELVAGVVEMFTDGACRGNPGPGGWGVLLVYGDREQSLSGAERHTTNNRMELMAAIRGLECLHGARQVRVTTDSQYLRNGVTRWIAHWKQRGWRTVARKPVKNIDLWRRLDLAASRHDVEWVWVRGHAGHAGNARADALARSAIDTLAQRGRGQ